MFNWRYYDRDSESERSLLWAIDTRFHEQFNHALKRLKRTQDPAKRYINLGRVVSYVQLVSSPAHTVPVFTARFWRFSLSDRFDRYPVDEPAIQQALDDDCSFVEQPATDYAAILRRVAADTLVAVRSPIAGLPTTWEAFWEFADEADSFGEYGPAGNNFGRATEFPCANEERCVLLNDDPLYAQFALLRHIAAVQGTMDAFLLMQRAETTAGLANAD